MKESLSILILNWKDITNPLAGGGTYYTHRVAQYLVKKGHKVTLICANYSDGKMQDIIDGVKILRIGNRYSVYMKTPLKLLKRSKMSDYDLVIDEINAIPWLTPIYMKMPKVAFIHQTAKEVLFEELNKFTATTIYLLEKLTLTFYRRIPFITVSQSVKTELVKHGIPEENITIIPPGIDVNKYRYSPSTKADFPLILYIGRLKRYKGIHYLIQAMGYVIKEVKKAKLSIVGEGNYRAKLEKHVQSLGLQREVFFHGYVPEEEKIRLLEKAWLLVIPSIKEGFGIVAIEAAACGTPAVGTNTMGLKDSIIHGKTGYLVPYGRPKILAEKICQILKNNELRERLSENARDWGRKFDWAITLKKFEETLYRITNQNN